GRSALLPQPDQLENPDAADAAKDGHPVELTHNDTTRNGPRRVLAENNLGAIDLVERLEAVRDIHRVADGRTVEAFAAADIADQHRPGIDADARGKPWRVIGGRGALQSETALARESRTAGGQRVTLQGN